MLVSLPEETPVNELIETAYRFEDLVGVPSPPSWSTPAIRCSRIFGWTPCLPRGVGCRTTDARTEGARVQPRRVPAVATRLCRRARPPVSAPVLPLPQLVLCLTSSRPSSVPSSSGSSPRRSQSH